MRSFFCEKCRLEFDLDEDFEEGDNTIFCPQCKINLAVMLPETPERIVMRERRLKAARVKRQKEVFRLILGSLAVLLAVVWCMYCWSRFAWLMLAAGLAAGVPAGLWVRRITSDRTYRAGILAAVLHGIGRPVFSPALRNLASCMITAWIFAVFERKS